MSELVLEALPRDLQAGKPRHMRREGKVPAVVYGRSQAPVSVIVAERNLEAVLSQGGTSQLVAVKISDGKPVMVLMREVQRDPITHRPLHADFFAVDMKQKQHVGVPVVGRGKPVTLSSGYMVLQNHEVMQIEALPADIPAHVEVDLTNLSADTPIKVSDLPAIKGVSYLLDPEEHVFSLVATQAGIEDETAATEESAAEPEVVKRGKEDEEAE